MLSTPSLFNSLPLLSSSSTVACPLFPDTPSLFLFSHTLLSSPNPPRIWTWVTPGNDVRASVSFLTLPAGGACHYPTTGSAATEHGSCMWRNTGFKPHVYTQASQVTSSNLFHHIKQGNSSKVPGISALHEYWLSSLPPPSSNVLWWPDVLGLYFQLLKAKWALENMSQAWKHQTKL